MHRSVFNRKNIPANDNQMNALAKRIALVNKEALQDKGEDQACDV